MVSHVDRESIPSVSMSCTIPGPPQPQERARRDPRSGRWFTPRRTRQYAATARQSAIAARPAGWPLDARYRVELDLHFGDRRRRDLDNVCKAVLDALNRTVWADDSQIVEIVLRGHVDREAPRAELMVEVVR